MLWRKREIDLHASAAERTVRDRDVSLVGAYELGDDGETEPRSARFPAARLIEPDEAFEDPLTIGRRDSGAVVIDVQDRAPCDLSERDSTGLSAAAESPGSNGGSC